MLRKFWDNLTANRKEETARNRQIALQYSAHLKQHRERFVQSLQEQDIQCQQKITELNKNALSERVAVETKLSAAKRHLHSLCETLARSSVVQTSASDPCVNAQNIAEALINARDQLVKISGKDDVDAVVSWAKNNAGEVKRLKTRVKVLRAEAVEAAAEKTKLESDVKELRLKHAAILISLAQQQEQCSADKTAAEQAHLTALDTLTQQVKTLGVEARVAASEKGRLEDEAMTMSIDHNAVLQELAEQLQECLKAKPGDNVRVEAIENLRQQVVSLGKEAREAAIKNNQLEKTAMAKDAEYRAEIASLSTQLLECSKANLKNNTSSNTLRDTLTEEVESLKVELETCRAVEKKGLSLKVEECLAKFKVQQDVAAAKAREAEEITENNRLLEQSLNTLKINLAKANAKAKTLYEKIDTLDAAKLVDAYDLHKLEGAMARAQDCRAALIACTSEKEETVKELNQWRQSAGLSEDDAGLYDPHDRFEEVINLATQELQTQIKQLTTKVNTLEAQLYDE